MKIVVLTSWFSENMGYIENLLPKAFAKLGHDVHVVTSNAQIYFDSPNYQSIYAPHLGPPVVECCRKNLDGYELHRLPVFRDEFGLGIAGLDSLLNELSPDIIQTVEFHSNTVYDAALYAKAHATLFCIESHLHASVFQTNFKKSIKAKIRSYRDRLNPFFRTIFHEAKLCYVNAEDVAEIMMRYYGVKRAQIKLQPLGVDTEIFSEAHEKASAARSEFRSKHSYSDTDIVCIYTGRFTRGKNPHCLADAIELLHNNGHENFKGFFLGNGEEEDTVYIQSKKGCITHPFVLMNELPEYYCGVDIAVWPREESTSQLDAAASGLPVILSNNITVMERVDGNGLLYREGDHIDLAEKLLSLNDGKVRETLGQHGRWKMKKNYSWLKLAEDRIYDYLYFSTTRSGAN